MKDIARTVVRYYAALRISAGAALAVLTVEVRAVNPVVRSADSRLPGGLDRREVIGRSGQLMVITLPLPLEHATATSRVLQN